MATVTAVPTTKVSGGSFLIEERTPDEVFTPEDFTEQHLLIAQTAEEFANKEIVPNIERMEHKDFAVTRELVRKAGELGLSGVDVPEQYGGMQLDKVTSAIIADRHCEVRRLQHYLGRAQLHRHPSNHLFRHRRTEKEIPAWTGERRNRGRVRSLRIVLRVRRPQLPHPGHAFALTASTTC